MTSTFPQAAVSKVLMVCFPPHLPSIFFYVFNGCRLLYQALSLAPHSPLFSSRPIENLCPLRSGNSHRLQVLCRLLGHHAAERAVTLPSKPHSSIPTHIAAKNVPRGE